MGREDVFYGHVIRSQSWRSLCLCNVNLTSASKFFPSPNCDGMATQGLELSISLPPATSHSDKIPSG